MPMYEFTCNACHHRFSALLPYQQKDQCTCPECGSRDLTEHLGGFSSPGCGGSSAGIGGG